MAGKTKIAIVGAGHLGAALAESLHAAGYRISEIVSRDTPASRRGARALARRVSAQATTIRRPELTAEIVWFCVPDRAIAAQAEALARAHSNWRGKIAVHSSGALDSGELAALRRRGAATASAHPLMTFVADARPSLAGIGFAVEGQAAAVRAVGRLIAALGGRVHPIRPRQKVLYHAWGTFASPLMIALLAMTERVAAGSGVGRVRARQRMAPILRQTLENYLRYGPAGAFSGPIIRGDAETVRKHLRALRAIPGAEEVYRTLLRAALRNLPTRNRKALMGILRG